MSEKNDKDENLSASKVYEILKSSAFQKKLYWDILASIKEKASYKYIREMIEKVVNQQGGVLENVDSEANSMTKKSIVAQLCSLGYTQDTVFSKIVFMDMEKAVKAHTPMILNDLRNEGRITDKECSVLENHKDSIENSNVISNLTDEKAVPAAVLGKRKRRGILKNEVLADVKKVNDVNYKDVMLNDAKQKKDLPKKKLGGRIQVFPNKNAPKPATSTPVKKLTKENLSLLSATTSKTPEDNFINILENALQAKNKEIDVCDAASISSVHTSDLSSFDDEISLSSEDEEDGKKKRLSLKEVQEKLCQKRMSSCSITEMFNGIQKDSSESKDNQEKAVETRSQKIEKKPCDKAVEDKSIVNNKKPCDKAVENKSIVNNKKLSGKVVENKSELNYVSTDDKASNMTKSASNRSSDGKNLPKRARKPNSRYSSDTIICTSYKIKERIKSSVACMKDANEIQYGHEDSPKSKKLRIENDTKTISANETKTVDTAEGNNKDVKTPAKESSDQLKPHPAVRSLTSRRTAPVTLYSTAT